MSRGTKTNSPNPQTPTSTSGDHARLWRTSSGSLIFTGEPYGATGHDIAELVAELDELELELYIEARSPYYPGSTVLLIIHRRGDYSWCDHPGTSGLHTHDVALVSAADTASKLGLPDLDRPAR